MYFFSFWSPKTLSVLDPDLDLLEMLDPDPDSMNPDPQLCHVVYRNHPISVTLSTLHSFISVKKIFDEHVYLTQHAHEP